MPPPHEFSPYVLVSGAMRTGHGVQHDIRRSACGARRVAHAYGLRNGTEFFAVPRKLDLLSKRASFAGELTSTRNLRTKNRPRWQVLTVRGCRVGRPLRRCRTRFSFCLVMAPSCWVVFPWAPILLDQTTSNRQNLPAMAVFRAQPMGMGRNGDPEGGRSVGRRLGSDCHAERRPGGRAAAGRVGDPEGGCGTSAARERLRRRRNRCMLKLAYGRCSC